MSERCTKCSAILSDTDNKELTTKFIDDLKYIWNEMFIQMDREFVYAMIKKWEKIRNEVS